MGSVTNISWTDHTFNPWWGCTKVHSGCAHCYAERDSKRYGFDVWGKDSDRRLFGDKHWSEPVKWNKKSEQEGRRHRVFCASMADVFEEHPALPDHRKRLFDLICRTPYLDWQVLTKRPENALRMMVEAGLYACENPNLPRPQPNLWIGTSPCDQATAESSMPALLACPAFLRFVSYEPAIGPLDLSQWLYGVSWVIVGGESGSNARPFNVDWGMSTIRRCHSQGVACFVKQLGSRPYDVDSTNKIVRGRVAIDVHALAFGRWEYDPYWIKDSKGADPSEWPAELNVQQFPKSVTYRDGNYEY